MKEHRPIEQRINKERQESRQHEKMEVKAATFQSRHVKNITRWVGWSVFGIAVISSIIWLAALPKAPEGDILSRTSLHWHPKLTIYVKGEKQEIPANIGIGAVHQPVHTHSEDASHGVVHLEFDGLVRRQDTTLGEFFRSWGKDIHSFGTAVHMTVNGKENTELENYVMQDKDNIELRYE